MYRKVPTARRPDTKSKDAESKDLPNGGGLVDEDFVIYEAGGGGLVDEENVIYGAGGGPNHCWES